MRRGAAPAAALALLLGIVPALGSEPASHDVAVPAVSGKSMHVEWTGLIPPGASPQSTCVEGLRSDAHTINLTVPHGLYAGFTVRATFRITFSGPTDAILTVRTPTGGAASADNNGPDADESVRLVNPPAGTYQALVCPFAGGAQSYTGMLDIEVAAVGVCGSHVIDGVDLQTATIPDVLEALATGRTTSRSLVEAYLARIATYDRAGPKLNSIREVNPRALAEADALDAARRRGAIRGPLHGIPLLLKDNIGTIDLPTTAGSIALEGSLPLHDAFLTARLRAAGAIILGKANLSEFAGWVDLDMPPGYSSLGGQVLNAFHFGDPSGSSSGSGVAASMAMATAAIGTETSGSILSPSIANGIVGIKPTVGLVSRAGVIPLAETFDTPGPMARSVTDAAIVLGVLTGVDARDPKTAASEGKVPAGSDYRPFLRADGLRGARLGVTDADVNELGDEELALWNAAVATLERAGATIVHNDNFDFLRNGGLLELAVIPNEFKHGINDYLAQETLPSLRVRTLSDIIAYNSLHPDKMKYGQRLLQASDATLGNTDEPTAVAARTATVTASQMVVDRAMTTNNLDAILAPSNLNANIGAAALYPSLTVPAGATSGGTRPFGITFLGQAWTEPTLIKLAYAYEKASRKRLWPTKVNRGLCPVLKAASKAKPATRVRGERRTLPATGIGSSPLGAWFIVVAGALAFRMRRPGRAR